VPLDDRCVGRFPDSFLEAGELALESTECNEAVLGVGLLEGTREQHLTAASSGTFGTVYTPLELCVRRSGPPRLPRLHEAIVPVSMCRTVEAGLLLRVGGCR